MLINAKLLNRWRMVAGSSSEQGYYTIGPLICS